VDAELQRSWARTTALLKRARLTLPSTGIDEPALRDLEELLDHNELGLAFEVLVSLAEEQQAAQTCWRLLVDAAHEMRIAPGDTAHGPSQGGPRPAPGPGRGGLRLCGRLLLLLMSGSGARRRDVA
jgi:hypothetical protein